MQLSLRRVVVMLLMAISLLIFWYPLFLLIILDVHYQQPPQVYRACMIFAWAQPMATPLFCGIIYLNVISVENLTKTTYSNAIPLQDSASFTTPACSYQEVKKKINQRYMMHDTGFTNENFAFSNHGSPSSAHNMGASNMPHENDNVGTRGVCYPSLSKQHTLIMWPALNKCLIDKCALKTSITGRDNSNNYFYSNYVYKL